MPPSQFYAVLDPLRLECPACGRLICFGRGHQDRDSWNPLSSILTCPGCKKAWQLAIRAMPADKLTEAAPDQKPSAAQYLELRRQYAMGQRSGKRSSSEPANQWQEEGCTCWPDPWKASCRVHNFDPENPPKILPSALEGYEPTDPKKEGGGEGD